MSDVLLTFIPILALILLSGLFSGLTLGLLALDINGLQVLIKTGTPDEKKYAKKILPIRRHGNLLLCTLLLGNVCVNVALSIVAADIAGGIIGGLISTFLIVIFGEILPQAICQRHGLRIGAFFLPLLYVFMIALFVITYPISIVLNWVLGAELGTIYTKSALKQILSMHADTEISDITAAEASRVAGVLDFASKTVGECMTPLKQLFMLDVNSLITEESFHTIITKGFSRIPVYEDSPRNIIGHLLIRDLIFLEQIIDVPVRVLWDNFGRPILSVFPDTPLESLLADFQSNKTQIARVKKVVLFPDKDPVYLTIGIITLKDLIETLFNSHIQDDDAALTESLISFSAQYGESIRSPFEETVDIQLPFASQYSTAFKNVFSCSSILIRIGDSYDFNPLIVNDFVVFLVSKLFPRCKDSVWSRKTTTALLKNSVIREYDPLPEEQYLRAVRDPSLPVDSFENSLIYRRGERTSKVCILLSGKLVVYSGRDNFRTALAPIEAIGLDGITEIKCSGSFIQSPGNDEDPSTSGTESILPTTNGDSVTEDPLNQLDNDTERDDTDSVGSTAKDSDSQSVTYRYEMNDFTPTFTCFPIAKSIVFETTFPNS